LSSVTAASVVAAAAQRSTVVLTKSANGISAQQDLEQLADLARAVHHRISRGLELSRRLVRTYANAHRMLTHPRAQAGEGVDVGEIVADAQRDRRRIVGEQPADATPLA